jgi:single-strand DNA-binding protein
MGSLNKVMLIGNLTREPEVRYTPKGSAVCDLGIAVNRTYMTDNGEKMQETTYVDVVVWAKLAELAAQYLHKGRAVFIEGRLQMDTWEDKQTGQKRSKLRVVADNLQFLDSRREGEGGDMGGGFSGGSQEYPSGGGYGGGNGNGGGQRSGYSGGGGYGGGNGGGQRSGGGGGYGGGNGGGQRGGFSGGAPQRQAPPQRQSSMEDDFDGGPMGGGGSAGDDGMSGDEIPF